MRFDFKKSNDRIKKKILTNLQTEKSKNTELFEEKKVKRGNYGGN